MMISVLLAHLALLLTAGAYLITGLRLITYTKNGARHRPGISVLAGALTAATLVKAVVFLLYQPPLTLADALIAVTLCAMVVRARGNLAALLRTDA